MKKRIRKWMVGLLSLAVVAAMPASFVLAQEITTQEVTIYEEELSAQQQEEEIVIVEEEALEEEALEEEALEEEQQEEVVLSEAAVAKDAAVSGSFPAIEGMDIATVRYYLDEQKETYRFADVEYDSDSNAYRYTFFAPYDGFEAVEATSLEPKEDATIIAQYYSTVKWDGAVDVSWYNETDNDFYLYNPAELAGFAAVVNGSVDGTIQDYQVKGFRSHPENPAQNRGLPDCIESTEETDIPLIAGVIGDARKGVVKHDFANRTVHIMSDMDMGGVPGEQIDHSLNTDKDVYKARNAYDYPNWTPIGGEYLMDVSDADSMIIAFFNGTIEGHGHYINNLYCFRWAYASVGDTAYGYAQGTGLVGCMGALYKGEEEPEIIPAMRNLGLTGYVYGRRMVGGFVGCVGGGSNAAEHSASPKKGILLENLVNHAEVHCTDSKGISGILACSMAKGSIINCYNTGNLDSTYGYPTGGIIGANEEMNVYCCYNTGTVTSSSKNGRGIGSDSNGSGYTVDNCYYLEGCSDDVNFPGYYTYNLAPSVTVNVSAMTQEQMKDGTLLAALNVNGTAYVEGDDGYPVLYWEKNAQTGMVTVAKPEGGIVTADKTGPLENGTVVYLENEADTGFVFRNYTLNGKPISGNYITVDGDCVASAYFEAVKAGVLNIEQNDICDIQVMKNGLVEQDGELVEVTNYPIRSGDPLYEGDMLIVDAEIKDGKVPEEPDLQYSATTDLAIPFHYEYTFTGHSTQTTVVKTYKVGSEINEADVSLTLNVVPLTTQKLWRYIGDDSWYDETASEFTITTPDQLAGLQMLVNNGTDFAGKTVKLGNDISLANNDGTTGKRFWDGIGTNGNPFAGTFDGQGYHITDYHGSLRSLFAYVFGTEDSRAAIKNLDLYGVSSGVEASGIVSRAKYTDIANCNSFCKVENGSGWSGGILGYAQAGCTVSNCCNYGKLEAVSKVGGIIGELSTDSSISDCINTGDLYCLNTGGNSIGGVVGSLNGQIIRCANYGYVKAWGRSAGGIAGQSVSKKAEITDSFNTGTISFANSSNSYDAAGGIVGYGSFYTIRNSFNYGTVFADATLHGGIVGREGRQSTSLTENVYYLDTSCEYAEAGIAYEDLPEATFTSGMRKASAEDFASVEGVLSRINGNGSFMILNQLYPEFADETQMHVHSGGAASCNKYARCEICGLEYGDYDPAVHLHFETKNFKNPIWAYDGYTGDVYCADCGALIESGQTVPADTSRQALEVDYNYDGDLVKVEKYSVSRLDTLKKSVKYGYSYGFKNDGTLNKTLMAVTEGILIEDLLNDAGLTYDDINHIVVWYDGNKDKVTKEQMTDCVYYFDEEGNRYDAPALLGITYVSLEGTLDVVAAGAESNNDLRFAYGMSQQQYDDKKALGGRRLVSPVSKIEVDLKEDRSSISGLEITTQPQYTVYHAGDIFHTDGMEVSAVLTDGTREGVTDYTVDKTGSLIPDDTCVTVMYDWKSVEVPISVSNHVYNDESLRCEQLRFDGTVCGQRESVDTDDLIAQIAKAEKSMEGVQVSEDGLDVFPRNKWVTPEVMETFEQVLEAAKALLEDPDNTQKKTNAMVTVLQNAMEVFNNAKEAGLLIEVKSVSLPSVETITAGESLTLVAQISPENATNQNVSWESSDAEVAAVAADGTVTGLKEGNAIITVTTEDGAKTAVCSITVLKKTVLPQKIALNKTKVEMATNAVFRLSVAFTPSDATEEELTWVSDNPKVVTVDQNGKVTAKTYGTAVITVTSKVNNNAVASCQVQTRFYDAYYKIDGTNQSNVDKETFNAIYWAADNKITGNTINFGTKGTLTRGQFVRFLHRLAGQPKAKSSKNPFTDVDKNYTHYKAILWAVGEGLIDGYTVNGKKVFKPENNLTRNQVATILWKWAGSPSVKNPNKPFADVTKSTAIAWGKNKGILTAASGNNFKPKTKCTRGEFAVFLFRYNNKILNKK